MYQLPRRSLVEELGIDPSPELQQLERSILQATLQRRRLRRARRPLRRGRQALDRTGRFRCSGWAPPRRRPTASRGGRQTFAERRRCRCAPRGFFELPADQARALTRVSQYVAVTHGVGPLYDELHDALRRRYAPGPVHRLLAALPPLLRARGLPPSSSSRRATTARSSARSPRPARRSTSSPTSRSGRDRGKFCHVAAGRLGDA